MPKISKAAMQKQIKDLLLIQHDINTKDYADYLMILEVLKKNVGKPYSQRLLKDLPGDTRVELKYGSWKITLPGMIGQNRVHYCGNDLIINIETFNHHDIPNSTGALQRIEQIEHLLQPKNLKYLVDVFFRLKKAYDTIRDISKELNDKKVDCFYNPAFTSMLALTGVSPKLNLELRFS